MLGKLFKNEFAKTWKIAVLGYGCSVGMSILLAILINIENAINHNLSGTNTAVFVYKVIINVFLAVGVISLIIIPVGFLVYLCIHFFKTMYSSQGYLTHTLPVSPVSTFNVKLLVSVIWMLGSVLVSLLSALGLATARSGIKFSDLFNAGFMEALRLGITEINKAILPITGATVGSLSGTIAISYVIGVFEWFLFVYAALSIGQLSANHKIGVSVAVGFGMNFVKKLLSGVLIILVGVRAVNYSDLMINMYGGSASFFNGVMWTSIGYSLTFCIIEYVVSVLIIRKHINLQ